MTVALEENAIGFGRDRVEWWVFADGIIGFGKLTEGVWTIQHFNGTVLHVPVDVLSAEDAAFLMSKMSRHESPQIEAS